MRASPLDKHLVPLNTSVPDIAVRRIRAVQRALEIANAGCSWQLPNRRIPSAPRFGYEVPLQSSDKLVRGRIDAVIPAREGPIIQDYKSGAIYEDSGEGERKRILRDDYQAQLKIYAALYAESFGEWPSSLQVVPLSGDRQEVSFSKSDSSRLLSEARAAVRRLNTLISTRSETSLPLILANPGIKTCAYCQYRPACGPYKSARDEANTDNWPSDVIGILADVKELGNGKLMLRILTENGLVTVPGLSPEDRHPALPAISGGATIGVFSLRRARPSGPYSESFLTTIHGLSDVIPRS